MDPGDLVDADLVAADWATQAGRQMSMRDLLAVETTVPKWSVPNLALVGNLTMLFAVPGAGKSTLYQEAIAANATGRAFVDLLPFSSPQRFLVFDWENSPEQVARSMKRLGVTRRGTGGDSVRYVFGASGINLDTDPGREVIKSEAREHGATCLIFDNRDRAFPNTPELEGDKVARAMLATKSIAVELDVAVLLISHEPKAEYGNSVAKLRGHTAWAASCDQMFRLFHRGGLRALEHAKHRGMDKLETLHIKLVREGDADIGRVRLHATEPETRERKSAARLSEDVAKLEGFLDRNGPAGRTALRAATAEWSMKRSAWGNDRLDKAVAGSNRIWQPDGKGHDYSTASKAKGSM